MLLFLGEEALKFGFALGQLFCWDVELIGVQGLHVGNFCLDFIELSVLFSSIVLIRVKQLSFDVLG